MKFFSRNSRKMKKISYDDLPHFFDESTIKLLRNLEAHQTAEWREIFEKMTFEQLQTYEAAKLEQIKKENLIKTKENTFEEKQNEWDREFRAFWIRYVNRDRSHTDLTIEDEINLSTSHEISENSLKDIVDRGTIDKILYRRRFINEEEKFTFFWETTSPFSQWHKSKFIGPPYILNDKEIERIVNGLFPTINVEYSSAEQFMMYHKAILFLDRKSAGLIMGTSNVREVKELGRHVVNFDNSVWNYFRSRVVYEGNKLKFTQNEKLRDSLFATKGTTLVEASPNDSIWGIGVTRTDLQASRRELWPGRNLLGEILTQIRIELMGEY